VATPLFSGVLSSNDLHKGWLRDAARRLLVAIAQPVVAILGLTYKPGTSTLRRSSSVELCTWLHHQGVRVQAHDPAIVELPAELRSAITLCTHPHTTLIGADVAVIATEWPDYRDLRVDQLLETMRRPQVIDQNRFLVDVLGNDSRIIYVATGKA
jgi:UDPglucose 6-dehydrogenase